MGNKPGPSPPARRRRARPKAASHGLEPHVGEVQLHLQAEDLPALYREAGRALAELMTGGRPPSPRGEAVQVEVRSSDPDALLVDWLNELIFRSERDKKVYGEIEVLRLGECELVARLRGAWPRILATQVKAATLHGVQVSGAEGRWEARVVLDV